MRLLTVGALLIGAAVVVHGQTPAPTLPDAAELDLRARVASAPGLTLVPQPITVPGVELGMVSWVTSAPDGTVYLLQRGDQADPIIAIDRRGTVLRSWGKGRYVMPHAIRIDPHGNVWTTDAASSHVIKYSNTGQVLLDIEVGGQPTPCRNNFCSTTDVAFAASGHVFISDGYANARILEYTAEGKKVREWGTAGTGPGQFVLPHSIQIDAAGVVYVADRENGRVQRFDQTGKYLGEWAYGKTFGLKADGAFMWLATQPLQQPNLSPGWLLKVDTKTGTIAGWVPSAGNHGMDVMASGELLLGPGPNLVPQWYREGEPSRVAPAAAGLEPWRFGMTAPDIRALADHGPYRMFSNGDLETYNGTYGGQKANVQFFLKDGTLGRIGVYVYEGFSAAEATAAWQWAFATLTDQYGAVTVTGLPGDPPATAAALAKAVAENTERTGKTQMSPRVQPVGMRVFSSFARLDVEGRAAYTVTVFFDRAP